MFDGNFSADLRMCLLGFPGSEATALSNALAEVASQANSKISIIEVDGQMSADWLQGTENGPMQVLPDSLAKADLVLVTMDAGSVNGEATSSCSSTNGFLNTFEATRSRQAEVAGLPVFCVLTRCDELASSGQSLADWLQAIEERKRLAASHLGIADAASTP
jgi:hypothetical protein